MKLLPTVLIFILAIAPMWYLAAERGTDELRKTAFGVLGVSLLAGIQALQKRLIKKDHE